jgi:hypothetical protein
MTQARDTNPRLSVGEPTMKSKSRIPNRAAYALLVFLVVGYLLQLATPLRINTDSYRMLSMAVSRAEGQGFLVDGHPDQFPIGYPSMVLGLIKLGLANSMALVAMNVLSLAAASFLVWHLLARAGLAAGHRIAVVLATLSSWVIIKHVTLPQSDLPYLGVSLASLACLQMFWTSQECKKRLWFVAGMLLAVAAILIRTVGLALLPAVALSLMLHKDHRPLFRRASGRALPTTVLIFGALLVVVGIVVFLAVSRADWFQAQFLREGSYFSNLVEVLKQEKMVAFGVQTLSYRLLEFGEVFVNLPGNKAPELSGLLYLSGLVAWLAVLLGCRLVFKDLVPATLYFISYCVLMLVWPYYDSRFWLPVVPLMAVFAVEAADYAYRARPRLRWVFGAYTVLFLGLGVAALGFSARISLSGREFSEVYGDGHSRMTYRFALDNGKPVDMSEVDVGVVRLLAIFEPRVSQRVKASPKFDPFGQAAPREGATIHDIGN